MELFGNAAARKINQPDDTTRALHGSVKLVENVERSRQVVERGCPQSLPKLYEKKKKEQCRISIFINIAIFVLWEGKKAKFSGKVDKL